MAEVKKKDFSAQFPVWFKAEPGFKYREDDTTPCIVIGWGSWRDSKPIRESTSFGSLSGTQIVFMPCGLLCAWHYGGEWFLKEVLPADVYSGEAGWPPEFEKRVSGWS